MRRKILAIIPARGGSKSIKNKNIIKLFGRPIVSTSANVSGQKVPLNFSEIDSHIKDNVDYIVKNEKNKNSFSSSRILRLNDDGSFYKIR